MATLCHIMLLTILAARLSYLISTSAFPWVFLVCFPSPFSEAVRVPILFLSSFENFWMLSFVFALNFCRENQMVSGHGVTDCKLPLPGLLFLRPSSYAGLAITALSRPWIQPRFLLLFRTEV